MLHGSNAVGIPSEDCRDRVTGGVPPRTLIETVIPYSGSVE